MTTDPNTKSNLVARIKGILLSPDKEWAIIDQESTSVAALYRSYVVILAAITPAATFLRGELFGYGVWQMSYRPPLAGALIGAIVQYVLTLAMVYVLALIINALAPSFQGQKNQLQALKLAAYAGTAAWLAGIFQLIPGLSILGLLGLYTFYLLYRGIPVLMKAPADKALVYTAAVVIVAVILMMVVGAVSGLFVRSAFAPAPTFGSSSSITSPIGSASDTATVNSDRMQQAVKSMAQSLKHAETSAPISTDTLKSYLPEALPGGLARSEVSSAAGQMGGTGAANVEAKYGGNGVAITLTISDLGAFGAMAAMSGALGVTADRETANSYSKVWHANGRTLSEQYDNQNRSGTYGVIVANRFSVQAHGSPVSMDDLHAAVASVDLDKLQALAK